MLIRCVNCGILFDMRPSVFRKVGRIGPCCSRGCSAERKSVVYTGSGNPNFKYIKNLSMFYELTDDGAYVLGMIYSDGHLSKDDYTIEIYQHEKYGFNIHAIARKIFGFENIDRRQDGMLSLVINDKQLMEYILSLGGIKRGDKSSMVSLPNIPEDRMWSFIAGYFDGDGSFHYDYRYPQIDITSSSNKMLQDIAQCWNVDYNGGDKIYASGYKALDICGRMYAKCSFKNSKKYDYYIDILNWEPFTSRLWYKDLYFKCKKLDPQAIIPTKERVTDSGYDVYAIALYKEGPFYVADTRIAIEPIPGYYFQLFGRSSLPVKFGFQFSLGTGIIDRSYVGALKMYLLKLDDRPLPELPFKCGQIIPTKIMHLEFTEVNELTPTERGDGGFGSTGR